MKNLTYETKNTLFNCFLPKIVEFSSVFVEPDSPSMLHGCCVLSGFCQLDALQGKNSILLESDYN